MEQFQHIELLFQNDIILNCLLWIPLSEKVVVWMDVDLFLFHSFGLSISATKAAT